MVTLLNKYASYNYIVGIKEFDMRVTQKMLVESEFSGELEDGSDSDDWVQDFEK